jgi:ATP adenylyltransferase/5',5'''-P-1,P-4-tetraphosphate phosphorylase II
MSKKEKINEVNISKFINKFFDAMQQGTQDRFIQQAKKKGVPDSITTRLRKIDQDKADLAAVLRKFK